jgi:hypothetical protein
MDGEGDIRAIGPNAAKALGASLACLAGLRTWDQVAALAERVLDALRGVEGLDRRDRDRLARWSQRWMAVPAEQRAVVERLLDERDAREFIGGVVWGLLELGREPEPEARGRIRSAYRALTGDEGPDCWRTR